MPDPIVQCVCKAWCALAPDVESLAQRAAQACLVPGDATAPPPGGGGLTIVLADDALLHQLNRDHRGQDQSTNVLAFAAVPPPPYLGDVILSHETLLREARAQGKSLGDHLSHLVVHGVLHLLGYDHDTDKNANQMEACEIQILKNLGIADPYTICESALATGASGERYG